MDPRLLSYYNQELQFVRDTGAEFADEFPKIASRLALEAFECADPYVERLFEGFALLAARVQLKIDAEFPRFTQHLLELVCPHYLAPQPSMAVVQFDPDLNEGSLADGFTLPRESVLRGLLGKGEQTACIFRTAAKVTLWPLELVEADYFPRSVVPVHLPPIPNVDASDVKAGLRLRLRTTAGLKFDQLSLERLTLYLRGGGDQPMRLCEQLLANSLGMIIRPADQPPPWAKVLDRTHIRRSGFDEEQAMLPYGLRSFQGHRLLQEYFAFAHRFLFVELTGLGPAVRCGDVDTLDIFILLDHADDNLANQVGTSHFSLFAAPAINLFPKRADRIHLSHRFSEQHIVPDRTRPMDFEVYQVEEVTGHGTSTEQEQQFLPFYAITDDSVDEDRAAYYTIHRKRRRLSSKQQKYGSRSPNYIGSEVFASLVDAKNAPYHHDLKQLSVKTLCTNRDLPMHLPVGVGETDFTLEESAPVEAIRCVAGPTKPRPSVSYEEGQAAWRLISHMALNYLSLVNNDERKGAAALREMLALYSDGSDASIRKQIDGVKSIETQSITRPISTTGPLSFARGIEITLTLDESRFEGTGVFLLGSVLEEFFARYVSINSFTETVLRSTERGEVMRWPARIGRRQIL